MKNADVIVKYSYEDEVESSFITIKFEIVYNFKYVEMEYFNESSFTFGLIEVEESNIKEELIQSWTSKYRTSSNAFGGELEKVKHYRICFDDYGVFDIICKNLKIEETKQ